METPDQQRTPGVLVSSETRASSEELRELGRQLHAPPLRRIF